MGGLPEEERVLATDLHVQATYRLTEALVESENRARRRVELLSEVVFETDAAGLLVFLNSAWTRVLGYMREHCLGKGLTTFVDASDVARVEAMMEAGSNEAERGGPRIRVRRLDGGVAWMELTLARLPDGGWVGALHDVTREKVAQDELAKLSLVASFTDNFVIITDQRGRVEWVNQAFSRRTGYPLEEIIGRKPGEFLQGPGTDPATVAQFRRWLGEGCSFRSEILNYTRSGEEYWVTAQITPIRNAAGEVERFISIQADTTELKQAQRQLEEAKVRAETANEAKTQFLATISHEMRTPLNVILGSADLILDGGLPTEELNAHLGRINASAESLLRLITDMLDLSKIEAGQFDFERIPIQLGSCLENAVQPVAERARAKGLEFSLTIAPDLPAQVLGDPDRLRQIVINLAENAVKFTDAGWIRVEAGLVPGVDGRGPQLVLRVEDTGSGIPEEFQARIFARFEQVDGSTTRRKGGAGLGLNIVKTLAEALGGTVQVRSQLGKGSEFRVCLPLEVVSGLESTAAGGAQIGSGPGPVNVGPATILVAEDTEANFAVARIFLNNAGFTVLRAGNGREAVAMAPEADLILMDIEMPEMDGLEATRRIREAEVAAGLRSKPILALTGHAVQGYRERCLAAGCTQYLTKPIRKRQLVEAVRAALAGRAYAVAERSDVVQVDPEVEAVVPQFLEHCESDILRLRESLQSADLEAGARVGHGMKGAALTMGFSRVAELSRQIVDACRSGEVGEAQQVLELLAGHLRQVVVRRAGGCEADGR